MKYVLILGIILVGFGACKKKKKVDQPAVDEQIINEYIASHNLNANATGSGLHYVILNPGMGSQPNINSDVTVKHKGYLTDGSIFDQTTNTGATFNLSGVIKGWQEGIPIFKKGGKGILLIPSALGYGDRKQTKIPANSVLIFDVELLDVK